MHTDTTWSGLKRKLLLMTDDCEKNNFKPDLFCPVPDTDPKYAIQLNKELSEEKNKTEKVKFQEKEKNLENNTLIEN